MEPRNSSSNKWTPFPDEFAEQLQNVFMDSFADRLGGQKLIVDGRIYSEEILLRIGFREVSALKQANFEVSIDFNADKDKTMEIIYQLVDFLATVLTEYFEGKPDVSFPTHWKLIKFQSQTIYFQYSTVNTDLESEADHILGFSLSDLVRSDGKHPQGVVDPKNESTLH